MQDQAHAHAIWDEIADAGAEPPDLPPSLDAQGVDMRYWQTAVDVGALCTMLCVAVCLTGPDACTMPALPGISDWLHSWRQTHLLARVLRQSPAYMPA